MNFAVSAVLALALVAPLGDKDKKRTTDPLNDPYTQNDPAILKGAGIVSMGGFDFGKSGWTTTKSDEFMLANDIRWIETAHFKIGFALGEYKPKLEE